VATISVATRTAEEFGCVLGAEVGYAIRFDAKCSSRTVIKYCTDGLLLRETLTDPLLNKYSVVIVDEVHERSLYTDVLLGLLKKIKRKRPELRLVVASATVNAMEMKDFFETKGSEGEETACVLSVTGRVHDVDLLYLDEPTHNFISTAVTTVLEIHRQEETGDILVFLPGAEDIENAIHQLEDMCDNGDNLHALPLYSTLPHKLQMRVFDPTPPGHRKVVFATNIAETSITIEGIKFVVDSGFAKMKYFNPEGGIDSLVTCPASKASLWSVHLTLFCPAPLTISSQAAHRACWKNTSWEMLSSDDRVCFLDLAKLDPPRDAEDGNLMGRVAIESPWRRRCVAFGFHLPTPSPGDDVRLGAPVQSRSVR
jgi:ATP-dependent RNA helicase DDX35